MATEVSTAAREICGRYFPTANSTLRSSPPHAILSKMRAAMDELLAAGIVTERSFNDHGMLEFTGTPAAAELHREHLQAVFAKSLLRTD